jgi:RNA binding exosome subunit
MIKVRAHVFPTANYERLQILPSQVIWYGNIDRFELFRNNVEGHYGKMMQVIYLIWISKKPT